MRKYLLPFLFLFLFVFESIFVQYLPTEMFGSDRITVPRFLIISILFLTVFSSRKYGIIYGVIFGLLFDIVYTGVIGIYLFSFPILAYLMSKLMRILQTNIVMVSLASLLLIVLLEIGVYEINVVINQTDLSFADFASLRLLPTVVLNSAFIIIASYPLKRHFEKFMASVSD
ncbi:rod shape-determining protein MreD [Bacillus mesophilum]|uniref:Rod shape-determining protein MreD n=1 Tax=Bacillus mesophilum TaxID=1071718 RepID=A0A7V7UWD3_9BACI|nr:rod shape-determining protein MreD [Bacillus mesophilum]KAB2334076.1 rod shape-determining protein MreD [Bacillus mesophilum]